MNVKIKVLILITLSMLLFSGCSIFPTEEGILKPPVKFAESSSIETTKIYRGNVYVEEEKIYGNVTYKDYKEISVNSSIKEYDVEIEYTVNGGDVLKEGDVMLKTVPSAKIISELEICKKNYDYANLNYEKALLDKSTSSSMLQGYKDELDNCEKQYSDLQKHIEELKLTIVAPYDCIVLLSSRPELIGSQPMFIIASSATRQIAYNGKHEKLTVGKTFSGTINKIKGITFKVSEIVEKTSGQNTEYVTYLDIIDGIDKPVLGQTAAISIETKSVQDVLYVSNKVIKYDRKTDEYYINILRGENKIKVIIKLGLKGNVNVEILSSDIEIFEGDTVIK